MNDNELLAAVKAEVVKQDPSMASMFKSTGTQSDAFDANMEAAPGEIPDRVIEELRSACHTAVDYAGAFSDACKTQAEKYKIKPGALKRYIKALEGDKLKDVEDETDDLATLIANRKPSALLRRLRRRMHMLQSHIPESRTPHGDETRGRGIMTTGERVRGGHSLHAEHDPAKCAAACFPNWRTVDCCKREPDRDVIECSTCGEQKSVRCNFDEEYS